MALPEFIQQLFWLCVAIGLFCATGLVVAGTLYVFIKLMKN